MFGYDIPKLGVQHHGRLEAVQRDWAGYRSYVEAALAMRAGTGGSAPAATLKFGSMAEAAATILADSESLIGFIVTDTQQMQQRGMMKIYALLLLDVLVLAAAFVAIRRKIVYPLQELSGYCA